MPWLALPVRPARCRDDCRHDGCWPRPPAARTTSRLCRWIRTVCVHVCTGTQRLRGDALRRPACVCAMRRTPVMPLPIVLVGARILEPDSTLSACSICPHPTRLLLAALPLPLPCLWLSERLPAPSNFTWTNCPALRMLLPPPDITPPIGCSLLCDVDVCMPFLFCEGESSEYAHEVASFFHGQ